MPEIKLKHVVSCSSEDNVSLRRASLSSDFPNREMESCGALPEKHVSVHLQVLLVTSSFMFAPREPVKRATHETTNRVRILLSSDVESLFIKLHSRPTDADDVHPARLTPSYFISLSALFLSVSPQNERWSYAAAALNSEGSSAPSSSSSSQQAPVKRKFEFSEDAAGPPPKKPSSSGSSEAKPATPKSKARSGATASPVTSASPAQNTSSDKREGPKPKPEPKPKLKAKSAEPVPFNRILEGVVFVLSGFQNPFRGELRDKALAMGARYRPDWTPDSTHLICAFANTPKYSQVKAAGGVIVRKEWVMDCHKTKKKISSKPYLLKRAESSSESEAEQDESEEETQKAKTPEKRRLTPKKQVIKEEEEDSGGSTDAEDPEDDASGMDTEDELNRVELESRRKKAAKESTVQVKDEDLYGGSTDENTDAEEEEDKPIPELPDFLTGKRFYLYGKFPDNQKRQLQRYIIAFNGAVEDYMSEKVQFVVTSEGWDESFEDALMENGNLSFVKPTWIFAINDRQKMLPYQPYTVVP
ncbi:DNA repair protein XRCC1-like [Cyprinus carpio]|uniref:DNA repair protein XRCC1-like n=1 Tax=Cyprinus carpio TaxID=7962 RepID=A0A9Q9YZI1_CYPCA|nr:DNA repair protein XRCC1-like [Cyprinus carpio]